MRTLRVGLIQALGRTKRCKGLSASALLLFGRFGWFLLRGVGYFIAIGQFLCSCVAPALRGFVVQHRGVVTVLQW